MLILNKSSWAQVCTVARRREVIIKFEETTRQNILLILTKPIVMVMRCIALVTCRLIARYVPKNYLHLQLEERESMKPFLCGRDYSSLPVLPRLGRPFLDMRSSLIHQNFSIRVLGS